jgi:hypothetical protein
MRLALIWLWASAILLAVLQPVQMSICDSIPTGVNVEWWDEMVFWVAVGLSCQIVAAACVLVLHRRSSDG